MSGTTRRVTNLLAAAVLMGAALAAGPGAPDPLLAEPDCTVEYHACIDEAREEPAIIREMGYVECMAEWTGCVLRKL